jgi:hypothetical protein
MPESLSVRLFFCPLVFFCLWDSCQLYYTRELGSCKKAGDELFGEYSGSKIDWFVLIKKNNARFCYTPTLHARAGQPASCRSMSSMLTYADVCWRMQMYADVCWRIRRYTRELGNQHPAGLWAVCWRMLTYADVCRCMLTYADVFDVTRESWATSILQVYEQYADVCWRMLTYADVCRCMLTYADVFDVTRESWATSILQVFK